VMFLNRGYQDQVDRGSFMSGVKTCNTFVYLSEILLFCGKQFVFFLYDTRHTWFLVPSFDTILEVKSREKSLAGCFWHLRNYYAIIKHIPETLVYR